MSEQDQVAPLDAWDGVVGQERAVRQLHAALASPVHAYLFVGPPGSTKDVAARAFAAGVLDGGPPDVGSPGDSAPDHQRTERTGRLSLARNHPDVREFERVGPAISVDQARAIVAETAMAPVEGSRKVLVLHEFHLVRPEAAAVLLKVVEEPPLSTFFAILADVVPPELTTIASRCVRIGFTSIPDDVVAARLEHEGHPHDVARLAAGSADGNLDRARLLVADRELAERREAFAGAPHRLDGTGSTAFELAEHLLALIESSAAPLAVRHADEVAELERRIEQLGERGSGRKALEDRHRRELRRHRDDELTSGLGAMARTYRDAVVAVERDGSDVPAHSVSAWGEAVSRIVAAVEALERNPNEPLLLQSLLWSLPAVATDVPVTSSAAPR